MAHYWGKKQKLSKTPGYFSRDLPLRIVPIFVDSLIKPFIYLLNVNLLEYYYVAGIIQ